MGVIFKQPTRVKHSAEKATICAVAALLVLGAAQAADDPTAAGVDAVRDQLKDPQSAQFRDVRLGAQQAVCGEVNSKNGYGGYVGFTKFWYAPNGYPGFEDKVMFEAQPANAATADSTQYVLDQETYTFWTRSYAKLCGTPQDAAEAERQDEEQARREKEANAIICKMAHQNCPAKQ